MTEVSWVTGNTMSLQSSCYFHSYAIQMVKMRLITTSLARLQRHSFSRLPFQLLFINQRLSSLIVFIEKASCSRNFIFRYSIIFGYISIYKKNWKCKTCKCNNEIFGWIALYLELKQGADGVDNQIECSPADVHD